MPSLTDAFNYCVAACNDPYIGYSIPDRKSGTLGVDYVTHFDCSSLMSKSMTVGGYFTNNPWFSTSDQPTYMSRAGWIEVDQSGLWIPGDILWYPAGWHGKEYGHTEMVYEGGTGKGRTMGAHTSGYAFARQVSINDSWTSAGYYKAMYRDPTGTVAAYKWHQSNSVLDEYGPDMTANAYMVYSFFNKLGFTAEAIAGLLGNMQQESGINPGRWQGGSGPGYGLAQWDPASNYMNYATRNGIDINDADSNGEGQCQCINDGEAEGQWLPNTPTAIEHNTRYSWAEFAQLTDVNEAVRAFLYEYERAGTPMLQNRYTYAAYWYGIITSGQWIGDGGNPSPGYIEKRRGFITDLQRRLVIPGRH